MRPSFIFLLVSIAIVSSQMTDQVRMARDTYRVAATTLTNYLLKPSGNLDQLMQLAFQVLMAAGSNVTALGACYGLYQTTSYVCNIAASSGVPTVTAPTAAPSTFGTIQFAPSNTAAGSTGYPYGPVHFPTWVHGAGRHRFPTIRLWPIKNKLFRMSEIDRPVCYFTSFHLFIGETEFKWHVR